MNLLSQLVRAWSAFKPQAAGPSDGEGSLDHGTWSGTGLLPSSEAVENARRYAISSGSPMRCSSLEFATDIPGPWLELLQWFAMNVDPEAAVAGGAVRECLLKQPDLIKDVDIWLYTTESLHEVMAKLKSLPLEYKVLAQLAPSSPDIHWLLKLEVDGVGFDVLCTGKPNGWDCKDLLEGFDYGICMCAANLIGVWTHPLFHEDVHHQTITYHQPNRAVEDKARSVNDHLERLKVKYPEFECVNIPDLSSEDTTAVYWVNLGTGGGY